MTKMAVPQVPLEKRKRKKMGMEERARIIFPVQKNSFIENGLSLR